MTPSVLRPLFVCAQHSEPYNSVGTWELPLSCTISAACLWELFLLNNMGIIDIITVATWNVQGLGTNGEELHKILKECKIKTKNELRYRDQS